MMTGIEIEDTGASTEIRTYILNEDIKTYVQWINFEKSGTVLVQRDARTGGYIVVLNDEITITAQRIEFR